MNLYGLMASVALHASIVVVVLLGTRSTPGLPTEMPAIEISGESIIPAPGNPTPTPPKKSARAAHVPHRMPPVAKTDPLPSPADEEEDPSTDDTEKDTGPPSIGATSGSRGTGEGIAAVTFRGELWLAIERVKEYPAVARARHQTGKVKIGFTLKKDGLITDVHLAELCDYALLNEAAIDTLKKLARFKPIPDEVSPGDMAFTVALNFKLTD